MGLFESIFKRQPKLGQGVSGYELLNAYTPRFKTSGGAYENELIRAAIDARARHISKLKIEMHGTAKPKLKTKLEQAPNGFQTWGQFLYRTSTILDNTNTCIIAPLFDNYGEIVGLYPILPDAVELVQFKGEPVVRCTFANGKTAALFLNECGILTKYQYKNDFFGETNKALTPLLELLSIQNQGISEGVKSAATYKFIATLTNFTNDEDLKKERQRFNEDNMREGGGVLIFPNKYKDIKQVDVKPYVPDADTLRLIEQKTYNYFGVNEDVLQNKAYGDKWAAFYEGALEPFAVQLSDVLTRMLYTERERAGGSYVMATANRLQYMSTAEKLQVSVQLADRGILNRDEVREIWNLAPLPDEQGQEYIIRGEYYNAAEKINDNQEGNQEEDQEGGDNGR